MIGSRSPFHGCHTPVSACGVLHRCVRPLFWGVSRNLGISIDEFFGITDKLTMSEEVLSSKNDMLRAHKKELEKHLVDNGKTMKIMMDGVRTRNRIIAALLVLLCLVAMYALYLDFHCVQIGFWQG